MGPAPLAGVRSRSRIPERSRVGRSATASRRCCGATGSRAASIAMPTTAPSANHTRTFIGTPQIASYDLHVRSHTATFGLADKFGGERIAVASTDAPSAVSSWSGLYLSVGLGIRSTRSYASMTALVNWRRRRTWSQAAPSGGLWRMHNERVTEPDGIPSAPISASTGRLHRAGSRRRRRYRLADKTTRLSAFYPFTGGCRRVARR